MPAILTLEGPRLGASNVEYTTIVPNVGVSINTPKPPPPPPTTTQRITLGPRGRGPIRGAEPSISFGRLFLISLGAAASTWLAMKLLGPHARPLRGPSMLTTIAKESRSPAEYARRAEAWNAAEARSMSTARLAKAYRKKGSGKVARLIREAREARVEGRERHWSRMSKGLR